MEITALDDSISKACFFKKSKACFFKIKKIVLSIKGRKFCFCVFILLILNTCFLILNTKTVNAQVFSLNPSSGTHDAGSEFTVDLNIDTQDQAVASADIKITFDSTILEVVKVEKGTFFSDEADYIGAGKLFVGGFFREQFATKNGNGKVAVIILKGKKSGTSAFSFACSTEKNDSNIFSGGAVAEDIIKCSGIRNGSFIITGSSAEPTDTPANTPTPRKKTSLTPPATGVTLPTVFFGGAGILLVILGIALVF